MESTFQKILRWTAIPGILGGLLYLCLVLNRFFPTLNTGTQSIIDMVFGIGLIFSIIFWLTGLYLWQKDEIKVTGLIGYVIALVGFIFIGIWLYISDFRDLEKTFSLWNSIAMILFTWGIMMFGTASINTGRFPHLATVLWMVGLVLGNAGLAYKWPGRLYLVAAGMIWCGIYFWIGYKNEKNAPVAKTTVRGNIQRVVSLDMLRGLIMVVMAIDHASMFIRKTHPFEFWNLPVTSYFGDSLVFLTRFVTHFCAPGFFFLMGTGMILFADSRKKYGWPYGKVMWHLAIRGFLIIALEKILWTPIVYGTLEFTKFGVLYGLGGAMLVGLLFLRLNKMALIFIGLTGILLTQVLPQYILSIGIYNQPLSILLLVPQMMGKWSNIYPVLPWTSFTVLGMVFGKEILNSQKKAYARLLIAGLICLVLFPIVRGIIGFGNFQPPASPSWIEFLNVVKYPPSLGFTLITLGVNCVLLYIFEKIHHKLRKWKAPLLIFGKTALYFYFAHWFLFSNIGLPFFFIKANLLWLYGGWAVGLWMLYPICSQYLEFKQRAAPDSVWRFI